jgi:DNA-binding NarL/FixJ family response regulator
MGTSVIEANVNGTSLPHQISVLLVDDEPRFRHGIRTLLGFHYSLDFVIVGEAASAEQAVQLAATQHPLLVLLDLELSQNNTEGIQILTELQTLAPPPKVLMVSGHQEDEFIFKAMQAGASGYVSKDRLTTDLFSAITTVLQGQVYLAADIATRFFRLFHFYAGRSLQTSNSLQLSHREQEVLQFLVEGFSNESIAQELYITVATVKAHLTSIFEKLGVKSRTQAIVKALKLGLV